MLTILSSIFQQWLSALHRFEEIKGWMAHTFLQLNESKSEILILGPSRTSFRVSLSASVQHYVRHLGVTLDSLLYFEKHITTVASSIWDQLLNWNSRCPTKISETVINVFVTSRLDYCNSLYCVLPQMGIYRLQVVQNASAKLLTETKKRDHISPILACLHWLPVKFRIDFKIAVFVYKTLPGLAPKYISDLVTPYSPQRALKSNNQFILSVQRCRCKTEGGRAFSAAAPKLPVNVTLAPSLPSFNLSLSSNLMFSQAFD